MNYFCINKSGQSVPVYSNTDKKTQIGTIYDREAFGHNNNWGGDGAINMIVFRNSSGSLSSGFIVDPPRGAMEGCIDYPYGSVNINGGTYKTFIMRQSRTVYTANGNVWGTVAANCRVACLTSMSGDSHPEWKGINYVESSKGDWVQVTGDGVTYGFVDAGLSVASGYNSIPMYGSW